MMRGVPGELIMRGKDWSVNPVGNGTKREIGLVSYVTLIEPTLPAVPARIETLFSKLFTPPVGAYQQ